MTSSIKPLPNKLLAIIFVASLLSGCSSSKQTSRDKEQMADTMQVKTHQLPSEMNRMVANPITDEIPLAYYWAIKQGTRTTSGKPGPNYWRQFTKYDFDVELIPADTLIEGKGEITYYNHSPDTLNQLFLELAQNLHKEGSPQKSRQELTGGINLERVAINDVDLNDFQTGRRQSGYFVNGTLMVIRPAEFLAPGDSINIQMEWNFKVPQKGASGRMGYSQGNLFYIGYWYPQMRVYDDVNNWFTDPFKGYAEFYHGFGDYNVDITVPEEWVVTATGALSNAEDVLLDPIYQRLQMAHQSDSVVNVIGEENFGNVTQSTEDGTVKWNYKAKSVTDFAFSVTKESMWDATRASVGDRDGDNQTDYVNINAIYRKSAPLWKNGAKFTSHAISFLSDYTDLAYPWPHMTSVEGGGIIGGGMEFPMMTLIGSYKHAPEQSLYGVTAHELAHMWVPMIVSTNERRYAWMDEGTTSFNENQAKKAYYPNSGNFDIADFKSYLRLAQTGLEGPLMRWSDYQYTNSAYQTASYPKPASILVNLRNLLGEKTFNEAYHAFLDRWKYKHPYPWDMFNTFEDVSGRNLDWFWRTWYYETWTLDQAVGNVTPTDNGTRIVVEDYGQASMPATVTITMADGSSLTKTIPVDTWLRGATRATITIDKTAEVTKVVIDPEQNYPDVNRKNNTWEK